MANVVGETLGQYQILKELGRGGMAVVYKAYQPALERYVALKVLPRELTFDQQFVERFLREAKAAARLNHPNIVTIHDVGEADGTYFIVMEYVEGPSLTELLEQRGALSPHRAAHIVSQAASALDYAHGQGFVHRDIKPGNILLGAADTAKLTDFGIVKAAEGTRLTRTGTLLGTPAYMSPEQARGIEVGYRTDVYSLGVVAYEMLSGRVPFSGETMAVLHAHAYDPPDLGMLPPGVQRVVGKALAKEPRQRHGSAGAFAKALEKAIAGISVSTVEPPMRVTRLETVQRLARVPAWGWGVGAAMLVIALVLAALGIHSSAPTASPTHTPEASRTAPTRTPPAPPTEEAVRTTPPSPTSAPTNLPEKTTGEDGVEMILIPAGSFMRGSSQDQIEAAYQLCLDDAYRDCSTDRFEDESPQREIYLDAFYIDLTEVTNAQFAGFVEAVNYTTQAERAGYSVTHAGDEAKKITGMDWRHPTGPDSSLDGLMDHPVIHISYDDAAAYCAWLGKRLPTEAEWEKAARGSAEARIFPWGDSFACGMANLDNDPDLDPYTTGCPDGWLRTAPVGSYPDGASPYGVLDMVGNIREWVADWYASEYYLMSADSNPSGPSDGSYKVARGGSWFNNRVFSRLTYRHSFPPAFTNSLIGFRCAADVPGSTVLPTSTPPPSTFTAEPAAAFQTISLDAGANAPLDFRSPPTGRVTLGGIPFQVSERIFKSQASTPPHDTYPTSVLLSADVPQAYRLHLLLNAGNGYRRFDGVEIGQVVANCSGTSTQVADLQLGRDIREWHVADNVVSTASLAREVWKGVTDPGVTAHIDLLSLELPAPCLSGRLTAIEVIDDSVNAVSSLDPALNLAGITVEYHR